MPLKPHAGRWLRSSVDGSNADKLVLALLKWPYFCWLRTELRPRQDFQRMMRARAM